MIKKQQKWVAFLVICTFVWLMQVSTMPVAAAGSAEQASSVSQGPDYYEAVGQKAAPAKKKSILPWILIGVGVVGVTAVLYFFVLKTKYDIRGTWTYKWRNTGDTNYVTQSMSFAGERKSGTSTYHSPLGNYNGTYTVEGKKLVYSWSYFGITITVVGEFTDKDNVTGTWSGSNSTGGDYTLSRTSSAAGIDKAGLVMGLNR